MDKLKALLTWLGSKPIWLRALLLALVAGLCLCLTISCGTTRAVVHNGATGTSTEIKITASNPTTVTASPNVQFNPIENGTNSH